MTKPRTEAEREYYRLYYKEYRKTHKVKYNKEYYREYYKRNTEKIKQQRLAEKEAELILKKQISDEQIKEIEIKNQLKLEQDLIIRKILTGYVKRLEYVFKYEKENELDYYRVVDIHISVFGYSNKYDILNARKQIEKMIDDLLNYLSTGTKVLL